MIERFKRWIGRVAQEYNDSSKSVPTVVAHGSMPVIQVFKITNGYIVSKTNGTPYRDDTASVFYCATPLDVARQIVNSEALQKMGIDNLSQELQTTGRATGSFNKV